MLLAALPPAKLRRSTLRLPGQLRVRSLIAERPDLRHSIADLEHVADLYRWSLARQFRAAFGTSPTRFRTMRQLDHVRRLVKSGVSLAEAALDAGFADQSHMSWQFKRAYGLMPRIGQRRSIERRVSGRPRAQSKWRVALATMRGTTSIAAKPIAGPRIDLTEPCSA